MKKIKTKSKYIDYNIIMKIYIYFQKFTWNYSINY